MLKNYLTKLSSGFCVFNQAMAKHVQHIKICADSDKPGYIFR